MIGAPNAGKSTLLNNVIGEKISIVTHKKQTTRSTLKGVYVCKNTQIIFLDTPGLFNPKRFIDKIMVKTAWKSSKKSSVICFLYDCTKNIIDGYTLKTLEELKSNHAPTVLILNKIDLVNKKKLLPLIHNFEKIFKFEETFMVSALDGSGTELLLNYLIKKMPEGPFLYDQNDLTDTPKRQIASEILREKLFINMHDEIPYNLIVETESWKEKINSSLEIYQNIYVTKKSHKGMIIGHLGKNIKMVGILARKDMENFFDKKVHLYIKVKVRENCLQDTKLLESTGLDTSA